MMDSFLLFLSLAVPVLPDNLFDFISADFSYPNLTTYLISYMRENDYNDCLGYSSFLYLVVAKIGLQGLSMPWLGGLAAKLGPRISVLGRETLTRQSVLHFVTRSVSW